MTNTGQGPPSPTLIRRLPWAWLLVAVLLTVGVLLREIGLLLRRVETEGQQAFGPSVYTGFPKLDQAVTLESARELWADAPADVGSLVAWHLWLDLLVLVPALTMLLALSLRRVREVSTWKSWAVWLLPASYLVADGLETATTGALFGCSGACDFPSEQPLWVVGVLSAMKWGVLAAAVTAIVVAFWRPGVDGQVSLQGSWARLRGPGRPVGSAGGLSVVVIAFVLVVALPAGGPLDQIPDVIRAQFEGDGREAAASTALAAVLVLAVLVAGVWSIRDEQDSTPTDPGPWKARGYVVGGALVVSVVLGATQLAVEQDVDWRRMGQPFAPVITVVALFLAAVLVKHWQGPIASTTIQSNEAGLASEGDPWDHRRWRAIALLVALVVLALGLGLVRAFAPVALTGAPGADGSGWLLLLGLITAGVGAPALAVLLTWLLSRVMPDGGRWRLWLGVLVATWTTLAAVLLAADPSRAWGGATGVLAACFAFFAIVTGLLGLASHRFSWEDTRTLGLGSRTPWGLVVVVSWLLASTLDFTGGYHDARVEATRAMDLPTLDDRFAAWRGGWDEGAIEACTTEDGAVPMVLVAAPGGGGKAAYWTGHAMDELFGDDGPLCPQSLFAVSGVSGGAVGLAVTLGNEPGMRSDDFDPLVRLTDDGPLAQVVAAMLLRDLPQPFVGAADGWADRAEVLETAWEEATSDPATGSDPLGTADAPRTIDDLGAGWWDGDEASHRPAIVLNSSSVTDGCRVLVSNVAVLPQDAASCRSAITRSSWGPAGPVALALDARAGLVDSEGAARQGSGEDCDGLDVASMRASTAALMAARFPYLTPSGALRRCIAPGGEGHDGAMSVAYGVDGGYLENTGLPALLEVWHHLAPRVEECNTGQPCAPGEDAWPAGRNIEPWVILLENHYRSRATAAPSPRPKELWVPLKALGSSSALRSTLTLEQQTAALMYRPLASLDADNRFVMLAPYNTPEVQAPLGWSLAESTREGMRDDVAEAIRGYCAGPLFRDIGTCAVKEP